MTKSEQTRLTILQNAFSIIYKNGYQTTSIDDIIESMRLTKGAFYYHFKTKDDMGLALIREVMRPGMHDLLVKPLHQESDPLTGIYKMMKDLLNNRTFFEIKYGCPAVNLIDEMAAISKSFSNALSIIIEEWQGALQQSIEKGRSIGKVRSDVQSQQVAHFIAAGYSGIRNLGKIYGESCYGSYLKELKNYLKSLQ